jgi:AraC family transcriptional regulator
MTRQLDSSIGGLRPNSGGAPTSRLLGTGRGWRIAEHVCHSGPADRAFEERHEGFTIAAVVDGSFRYRADTGTTLLHSGAVLLGNHGACFECGHDHSTGDRCIAFHFEPDYFADVAASAAGSSRFRFPVGALPAQAAVVPWLARVEAGLARGAKLEADEAASQLIELVIGNVCGASPTAVRLSGLDERRVTQALEYIERHSTENLDLNALAAVAGMSKYHFLRTFRRAVGMTPYQFLLSVRMRSAAGLLLASSAPVSSIAYEVGFGDLSTFNGRFRAHFGESPTAFRARERRRS